jgi:hypothetical protein
MGVSVLASLVFWDLSTPRDVSLHGEDRRICEVSTFVIFPTINLSASAYKFKVSL